MNKWQKDQFDKLEKAGYLPKLRELAMNMSASFFWSADGLNILHNGTLCYLKTAKRTLGITADHVYAAYLEDRDNVPDVEAQFGGTTVYPEKRLIDRDASLDLATFDVPELMVLPPRYFHEPTSWPIVPLKQNETIIYGGYPGCLKEIKPGQADFAFQSFAWNVSDVTPQNIVMNVDFANLYWPGHSTDEKINENPGGISGGPVYRIVEDVDRLELVGIIFEYLAPWETIRARHIDRIEADGTIRR